MLDGPFEQRRRLPAVPGHGVLPEKIAAACVEFVHGGLADNPRRVGHELRFDLEGKHSARRGDFGIVYEIDDDRRVVTVLADDHRSDIYRPR